MPGSYYFSGTYTKGIYLTPYNHKPVIITSTGSIEDNNGPVESSGAGVILFGGGWTLTNDGVINAWNNSVYIPSGFSTVTNAGLIAGNHTGVDIGPQSTVINSGTIAVTNRYPGVNLFGGGALANGSPGVTTALISGGIAGVQAGAFVPGSSSATVTNYGTIVGSNAGVLFGAGGSVTNSGPEALIKGNNFGVYISSGTGTVTNAGQISGNGFGINVQNAAGTVVNYAAISGGNVGVNLADGGIVTNAGTGAVITGGNLGVNVQGAGGTVANYGTILGGGVGASLGDGGAVTNSGPGALISGGTDGVDVQGATGTVTNTGTISGNRFGVYLGDGGNVTNGAGGLIEGTTGVEMRGLNGTLDNFGTIVGSGGTAVVFGGSAETLKIEQGSVLQGAVTGIQGSDVIDFANTPVTGLAVSDGTLLVLDNAATVASFGGFNPRLGASAFTLTPDGQGGTNIELAQPSGNYINGTYDAGLVLSDPATQNPTTIGVTGYLGPNIGDGVLGLATAAWTVTNRGVIAGLGTYAPGVGADGIALQAGGNVTNAASGLIEGNYRGINVTGAYGGVVNSGIIAGSSEGVFLGDGGSVNNSGPGAVISGYFGINIQDGGTVVNSGTIDGGSFGVYIAGGGTVANSGTIISGAAVQLMGGGTVANSGTAALISGSRFGINISGGPGAVFNAGTIGGDVVLNDGGSVTNSGTGALISGLGYVISAWNAAATVVNAGTVGSVYLFDGGSVTNIGTSALISRGSGSWGVIIEGAAGTVVNAGTIDGIGLDDGGIIVNSGTSSLITGQGDWGLFTFLNAPGTVVNYGTITGGSRYSVFLWGGGAVTNSGAGALISGGYEGVHGAASTVVNSGTISGSLLGVNIASGSVINLAGGLIEGNYRGVNIGGVSATVVNAGTIVSDSGTAVVLLGGTVANSANGALISGGTDGIDIQTATVVNAGTVTGGRYGVHIEDGGIVTNGAAALIEGGTAGVKIDGVGAIVDNFGTIVGKNGTAVAFGTYGQTLKIEQGSVLLGGIAGVQGSDTIDLVDTQATGLAFANGTLTVLDGATGVASLGFTQDISASGLTLSADGQGGTDISLAPPGDVGTISGGYGLGLVLSNPATQNPTTIAAGGYIGPTGSDGVLGLATTAWTLTNLGTIVAFGRGFDGVDLQAGGLVSNGANGVIHGADLGVSIEADAGSVANDGSITATGGPGVQLGAGGNVVNSGLITGTGSNTVTHSYWYWWPTGTTATGEAGAGIVLNGAGAVVNSGTVLGSGYTTNVTSRSWGFQYYTYSGGPGASGIGTDLTAGGSVTNTAGALIEGNDRGANITGGYGSVVNAGTIAGGSSDGVLLADGGAVTNCGTGALISGGSSGVYIQGGAGTVVTSGTIAGGSAGVILTDGGAVTNSGSGALIAGSSGGVDIQGGAGAVVTSGTVAGGNGNGVFLARGGSVTNSGTASLISGSVGVNVQYGGTVTNYGTITGAGAQGVLVENGAGTVVNSGSISAADGFGVQLLAGGSVFNSGMVSGTGSETIGRMYYYGWPWGSYQNGNSGAGVLIDGAGGLTNSGTILGSGFTTAYYIQVGWWGSRRLLSYGASGIGANLTAGGSVTNVAGGLIEGNYRGVNIGGASGTVINAGTISGGTAGAAVYLDSNFGGLVVADPGAVFEGTVSGGNASAGTLELASAASTGTLSGLGTQFVNFGSIAVDPGAAWLLTGNNTIASVATLTNAGSLSFTGTLDDAGALIGTGGTAISFGGGLLVIEQGAVVQGAIGGFLSGDTIDLAGIAGTSATLGANNELNVQVSGGGSVTLDLATNQNYAGYAFTVSSDGSGGTDINAILLDPGPTAGTGATTLGHDETVNLTSLINGLVTPGLAGDTETLTSVSATHGSATLVNGVVTYTAPSNGPDTLSYTVVDEYGDSATGSVNVTVDPGPAAATGATTLGHNETVNLTSLINGLVTPGLAGDTETLTSVSATHGSATLVNGVVTYTAPSNGPDTLSYTVVDEYGDSATGSVNATVDPGPAAATAATTLGHNETVNLTSLINGLVTPGLAGDTETLTSVSATHGSATLVNGVVTYTAPSNGPDTLSYTVVDEYGDSATGSVHVTVDPGPTAATGATTLGHNKSANLTNLINGLVTPGLSGDTETVTAVSATHGSATLVNGVVSYTAPSSGPDTLSYTVVDEYGDSATGSVHVTVDPGPIAAIGATTLGHNKSANLTSLINGLVTPGLSGDTETVTAVSATHVGDPGQRRRQLHGAVERA